MMIPALTFLFQAAAVLWATAGAILLGIYGWDRAWGRIERARALDVHRLNMLCERNMLDLTAAREQRQIMASGEIER